MQRTAKQMKYVKDLKKEVRLMVQAHTKYRIKEGPNKGKVL